MVIVAFPELPLVGDTVHHAAELVAVQLPEEVNDNEAFPPVCAKMGEVFSVLGISIFAAAGVGVGVGVGVGLSTGSSPPQADSMATAANVMK